jgi:hypothetical protein
VDELPLDRLIALHGAHRLISEFAERLTCRTCGLRPTWVDLVDQASLPQRIPVIWPNDPTGKRRRTP